jgi:hypothetical protein
MGVGTGLNTFEHDDLLEVALCTVRGWVDGLCPRPVFVLLRHMAGAAAFGG